jgi:DNA-binding transcriptional MerR regulator
MSKDGNADADPAETVDYSTAGVDTAQNDGVLSIKTVAKMFKVTPLTLRIYELRGLIRRHRSGRDLLFSWFDCERIALIIKARRAGISTGWIGPVIKAMAESGAFSVFDAGRDRCLSLIGDLERRQKSIVDLLAELHRIDWELSERISNRHPRANST